MSRFNAKFMYLQGAESITTRDASSHPSGSKAFTWWKKNWLSTSMVFWPIFRALSVLGSMCSLAGWPSWNAMTSASAHLANMYSPMSFCGSSLFGFWRSRYQFSVTRQSWNMPKVASGTPNAFLAACFPCTSHS